MDPKIVDHTEKFALAFAYLGSAYLCLRVVLALLPA